MQKKSDRQIDYVEFNVKDISKTRDFYKKAFGAEEAYLVPVDESGRTMATQSTCSGLIPASSRHLRMDSCGRPPA